MFVKIENYREREGNILILNIDRIISIHKYDESDVSLFTNKEKYGNGYIVLMNNGDKYWLNEEQYNALCEILTKKL